MMVTCTVITYPKFITLGLILPIILAINTFSSIIHLFQDHISFSYTFHTFQDHNSWYYIFHTFQDHKKGINHSNYLKYHNFMKNYIFSK